MQKTSQPVTQKKPATLIEALWAKAKRAWARTKYIAEDMNLRIVHGSTKAQEDEYQAAIAELRALGDGSECTRSLKEIADGYGELADELERAQNEFAAKDPIRGRIDNKLEAKKVNLN